MAKYNVSKSEAKKHGIKRVRTGGSKKSSKSSRSSVPELDTRRYDELSKSLGNTMRISEDEMATRKTMDNLLASEEMGLGKIKDQPIASSFIQGQGLGLRRQTLARQTPLQQRLARLQSRRASAGSVLSSQLSAEAGKIGFQQQARQLQASRDAQIASQESNARAFAESQRQFNENMALSRSRESRIGAGSSSGGGDVNSALLALIGQQGLSTKPETTQNFPSTKFKWNNWNWGK